MVLKISHRGSLNNSPENCIESFRKVAEYGIDFVEFDVRLTKDNKIVVIHDCDIKRTTDGKGLIKNFTLKELRLFHNRDNNPIPTIQEVFKILKNKSLCKIHIKENGMEEKVIRLVEENNIKKSVIITSELQGIIRKIKEIAPNIRAELGGFENKVNVGEIIKKTKSVDAEIIGSHYNITTKEFVEKAHKNGIEIHVWPANNKSRIERAKRIGVDGITSSYPEKI